MKKLWATAAVAVSIAGLAAATAPQALADDGGTTSFSGNGASQAFGNSVTKGDMSPQLSLVQGSLNKPCIGLPLKANTIVAAAAVLQDVPILSAPQNQQCTENSTQAKGDEPLSHILSDIPILSDNGNGNNNGGDNAAKHH
ncbi:rodlin [Streptomyces europaeiscabiei]|uniref:Rodlin n=1 Tax=Streptomyces europaeiscabiei TaxID=146819 RepID=A0ABU4NEN1_9ACTN|nr:rodlin [Streptomyces europaeiscabiei]MDX2523614.1 rodlin [Streptomyces europaeiscabiei]MDX2761438.1 rodlin [Streptomyces europaeiscabiei]MDX2771286.1 rodlin [Streptomyces europaeiscabiei]MDX3541355.1 rodlin [Streptomyces europaeiscabiei]MDX3551696.1 rodlin [Streptomyces europaeiscabiei]